MRKSKTGPESAAGDQEFTLRDADPVELGGTTYQVEIQHFPATGHTTTWLTGPRGAKFFLRGYLNDHTGRHEVVRWGGAGSPLINRQTGRKMVVVYIGSQIEEYVR